MSKPIEAVKAIDPVWDRMRREASEMAAQEPVLASSIFATILNHDSLEEVLSFHLARKLANVEVTAMGLREVFVDAYEADPEIIEAFRADIVAVFDRDPACDSYLQPLLFFKGFNSLQAHRLAHWLWLQNRRPMALFIQSRVSELFAVDIHPAATFGKAIMMDHATGVVIGETAVVGDDVSLLHGVNLGGTGKETGDRHPKVGRGVLLGADSKILGNITIGECARVGAGSVVLKDVPANCTVAGVPAKVIGCAGCDEPSRAMNQIIEEDGEDGGGI
ncbi:serine O-acetyltransferase [Parvibaculum lavamentivorans]|nr:serine O-acetyltransferase [Parvibaculum lavamentivorans]